MGNPSSHGREACHEPRRRFRLSPPQYISLSFAIMILIGALLLNLPIASKDGESIGFLSALFTATSAGCVTGLIVVNTQAHWSTFGHVVILLLIQFGGLGFISILTAAMVIMKRRISLRSRQVVQAAFNQESIGGMVRLVQKVVLVTLAAEGIGAAALTIRFATHMPFGEALAKGIFHSISAFCNAGFDIIGPESLVPYQTDFALNSIIMLLIILGGLGFTVIAELTSRPRLKAQRGIRRRIQHLSLHTKMVLTITCGLLLLGTVLFAAMEWDNPLTLGPLPAHQKILAALFQSVTLRTAGFNTIDQGGLTEASQFVSSLFMMVGGSPASTAGGMKTVTLGIILFGMLSVLRGQDRITAFERTLPMDLLLKALAVACTVIAVVFAATIGLYFTERYTGYPHSFLDLLFECASAAGTVGITTGITPHVSPAGRIILIACMYLGRLSPVTVVMALNMRKNNTKDVLAYMDGHVIIG